MSVSAPPGAVVLAGQPGSGKTRALVQRAADAAASGARVLVSSAAPCNVLRLRTLLSDLQPDCAARCIGLGEAAFDVLRTLQPEREIERIDDVRASHVFESVGARLYSLNWSEFVSAEIDPEITGLRAPERFSAAAFRLIRKLRQAQLTPRQFEQKCLSGATSFYGRPPNFASADLVMDTGERYRDSLRVTSHDLKEQYERELDLIRILVKLYDSYLDSLVAGGCLTDADAVFEATSLLRGRLGEPFRPYDAAFIDDAQDLNAGEIAFLEALFGAGLAGVTFAGDPDQATRTFAGARGGALLEKAPEASRLTTSFRCPPEVFAAARRALAPATGAVAPLEGDAVELYRASNLIDEAQFVAATAQRLIRAGVAPARIALITRSLPSAHAYIDGLLARDVPLDVAGEASLYDFPAAQDALAALWACADPFRHDYLMRNLEAPWLDLSDASIAALCADPPEPPPQPLLFELPEGADDAAIRGRWSRLRDLRLGRNVTRGDVDAELPEETRERLAAFRQALARWERLERGAELPDLARTILGETILAVLPDNARGRFERGLVERLLEQIDAFAEREPLAGLADFLSYAEDLAVADADLLSLDARDPAALHVLDVEAAKGREFDHVFVVDVRAGAFPRYYVPDAFLFTPGMGMIPKENVGPNARAARTAKFTYAHFRLKLREKYNQEERRAFYCAATRARERLYVSAWGRPTKGRAAPELLEELMAD